MLIEQRAESFVLFVRELNKSQAKAKRRFLVSDLTGELEPLAIRQLQFEGDHFADLSFAHRIDVAATIGQIRDAGGIVSALTVPNGVQTNIPSFFGSAVAHSVSHDCCFWRLALRRWQGERAGSPPAF